MTNIQRHAPGQRRTPLPGELSSPAEVCQACRQTVVGREAPPHARLMITSSTPVIEAFGGGVETRYVCLECGHSLTHSTGRFGQGWR